MRCRTTSNTMAAVAADTFSELALPAMGSRATTSAVDRAVLREPVLFAADQDRQRAPAIHVPDQRRAVRRCAQRPQRGPPRAHAGHPGPELASCAAVAMGSAYSEPIVARTVSGSYRSTEGSTITTPCAPAASAVRMIAPRLPGVCSCQATTTSRSGRSGMSCSVVLEKRTTAAIPCGSSRSDRLREDLRRNGQLLDLAVLFHQCAGALADQQVGAVHQRLHRRVPLQGLLDDPDALDEVRCSRAPGICACAGCGWS